MGKMKPILFNTEMVKAILDGRKTVTRRLANINTEITCNDGTVNHEFVLDCFSGVPTPSGFVCRKCGFGVAPPHSRVPCGTSLFRPRYWPGDILYVRETWAKMVDLGTISYAGYVYRGDFNDNELQELEKKHFTWKPSIHMPKEAARVFLRVTDVRVKRLQTISADECPMEGVWPLYAGLVAGREAYYKTAFAKLWDSTIKSTDLRTCGWEANPWVWVIKFERINKEEART